MNTQFSLVLVAVFIGLSPALTVGAGSAHAANDCDFEFTRSVPTVLGAQITGSGWAACADVPPDTHSLTLALEYEDRGRWMVASQKTDTTVPPRYPSRHSYDVSAACYGGTWAHRSSDTRHNPGTRVPVRQRVEHPRRVRPPVPEPILIRRRRYDHRTYRDA